MTTGRINQVTILDRGPRAKATPPQKESGKYTEGRRRSNANRPVKRAPRVQVRQATYSNAPTEFPKERSATGQARRCRLTSPLHTVLRRREYWLHHAHKARLCSSIIPKRLKESWQSQQSTDPRKGAC